MFRLFHVSDSVTIPVVTIRCFLVSLWHFESLHGFSSVTSNHSWASSDSWVIPGAQLHACSAMLSQQFAARVGLNELHLHISSCCLWSMSQEKPHLILCSLGNRQPWQFKEKLVYKMNKRRTDWDSPPQCHCESLLGSETHFSWACHLLSSLFTVHIAKCIYYCLLSFSDLGVPCQKTLWKMPNVNLACSSGSLSALYLLFSRALVIWHCIPGRLSECQLL